MLPFVLVVVMLALLAGAVFVNGWVLQRAARWVGVELTIGYAAIVAIVASIGQTVAQLVVAVAVIGTSDFTMEAVMADQWLIQLGGIAAGMAIWTSTLSVLLDIDLPKAAALSVLFGILSAIVALFLAITLGNLLLVFGLLLLGWGGAAAAM